MAQSTIAEDITRLEAELANLRSRITNQEHLREQEEGGNSSKFRTSFTDVNTLYKRESTLQRRLDVLYRSQS